jgi:hypothetical protein
MATHPSCSLDLAPSHFFFYLFGPVKGLLRGDSFEAGEDLSSAVEVILGPLKSRS